MATEVAAVVEVERRSSECAGEVVAMIVLHYFLHSRSLRSLHPIRLKGVPETDSPRVAEGTADLRLGAEAVEMKIGGNSC